MQDHKLPALVSYKSAVLLASRLASHESAVVRLASYMHFWHCDLLAPSPALQATSLLCFWTRLTSYKCFGHYELQVCCVSGRELLPFPASRLTSYESAVFLAKAHEL